MFLLLRVWFYPNKHTCVYFASLGTTIASLHTNCVPCGTTKVWRMCLTGPPPWFLVMYFAKMPYVIYIIRLDYLYCVVLFPFVIVCFVWCFYLYPSGFTWWGSILSLPYSYSSGMEWVNSIVIWSQQVTGEVDILHVCSDKHKLCIPNLFPS